MGYRLDNWQSRWLSRLVLVALLATSTSISWASPILGPHCSSHAMAAHGSSTHATHEAAPLATPSWTQGPVHECQRCPPSECSQVAPCATAGSVAAAEASALIAELVPHAVLLILYNRQHPSSSVQPPTPPP